MWLFFFVLFVFIFFSSVVVCYMGNYWFNKTITLMIGAVTWGWPRRTGFRDKGANALLTYPFSFTQFVCIIHDTWASELYQLLKQPNTYMSFGKKKKRHDFLSSPVHPGLKKNKETDPCDSPYGTKRILSFKLLLLYCCSCCFRLLCSFNRFPGYVQVGELLYFLWSIHLTCY